MASNDKTVFDGDATVYEDDTVFDGDATVFDGDETVLEDDNATVYEDDDATVYEVEDDAAADKPLSNEEIVKGGSILDTYTVESDPIHGGMGSVWRVHHKAWNADLAMKRPRPRCFATEKSKERFIEECKTWIDLGLHPNIVSCYYVREIGGTPTIFSEWMEYGSLENRIEDESLYVGSENEQQMRILDIAIQFARGLHYAHEQGRIHQDVKPDNLLLTKAWAAKVADFGLAKARAMLTYLDVDMGSITMDGSKTIITPSGGRSPHYCSMEQMDGKPLTRKTDIYSWAVSVLEMYLGYKPWANGAYDTGPIAGMNCREYFAMTRLPMPEALKELLAKCLAAEPENRPHDFGLVEEELKAIYKQLVGTAYPRELPEMDGISADNLNNQALSMLDLGEGDSAQKAWEEALAFSPDHAASIINQAFYQWHSGMIDDQELERRLSLLPACEEKDAALEQLAAERPQLVAEVGLQNVEYIYDADFDTTGSVWLADGIGLARYDCKTGELLDRMDEKRGEGIDYTLCTAVAADSTGRYVYLGVKNRDKGFYSIYRMDRENANLQQKVQIILPESKVALYQQTHDILHKMPTHGSDCLALWLADGDATLYALTHYQNKKYWIIRFRLEEPRQAYIEDILEPASIFNNRRYKVDREWARSIEELDARSSKPEALSRNNRRWGIASETILSLHGGVAVQTHWDGGQLYAINRDEQLILNRGHYSEAQPIKLYRLLEEAQAHIYRLSRFAEISLVLEREDAATKVQQAFEQAVAAEDYNEAIRCFEEYRELPEKQDAIVTEQMEKTLSKACRRTGLHHAIEVYDRDFSPMEYTYQVRDSSKGNRGLPDDRYAILGAETQNKKLVSYTDDKGTHQISRSGKLLSFRKDYADAFLCAPEGILRLDFKSRSMTPVLAFPKNKQASEKDCVLAPNCRDWLVFSSSGSPRDLEFWYYKNCRYHKSLMNIGDRDFFSDRTRFSPDSRFLYSSIMRMGSFEGYLINLADNGEKIRLPDELKGGGQFSKDGLHIAVIHKGEIRHCFRLSYNYAFTGFVDWDEEADGLAAYFLEKHPAWNETDFAAFIETLQNHGFGYIRPESVRAKLSKTTKRAEPENRTPPEKKSGLFSGLFGKKK